MQLREEKLRIEREELEYRRGLDKVEAEEKHRKEEMDRQERLERERREMEMRRHLLKEEREDKMRNNALM